MLLWFFVPAFTSLILPLEFACIICKLAMFNNVLAVLQVTASEAKKYLDLLAATRITISVP
jgi:hypothetical protein